MILTNHKNITLNLRTLRLLTTFLILTGEMCVLASATSLSPKVSADPNPSADESVDRTVPVCTSAAHAAIPSHLPFVHDVSSLCGDVTADGAKIIDRRDGRH